jgi:deoxyhypusine synthase
MGKTAKDQMEANKAFVRKHFPLARSVVQHNGDYATYEILNMGTTGSSANSTTDEATAWYYAAQAVQRKLDREAKLKEGR